MSEHLEYLILFFAAAIGAVFGSFVNMAATRIPRREELVHTKSHCRSCKKQLNVFDLFPVISWLFLKGRCRYCKEHIGVRYFVVELSLAIIFMLIFMKSGFSLGSFILAAMAVCLAIIIIVDFENYIIPDSCSIILLVLGVLYSVQLYSITDILYGGALGLAVGLTLRYFYLKVLHKDALGMGDVKFLGVSGIWLGPLNFIPFIFFSGIFGIITGLLWQKITGKKLFPFGPALALSLFMLVCFPEVAGFFWKILGGSL